MRAFMRDIQDGVRGVAIEALVLVGVVIVAIVIATLALAAV